MQGNNEVQIKQYILDLMMGVVMMMTMIVPIVVVIVIVIIIITEGLLQLGT
jgi:hypothetical protein